MADDTSKRGENDRSQVAGDQPYEVDYFAGKHGISRDQAQTLIDRVGNDRAKLDAAANKLATPKSAPARGAGRKPATKRTTAPRKRAAAGNTGPLEAITAPVAEAVAPAKRGAVRAAKTTAAAVRRGSASARRTAKQLPGQVERRTGKALQDAKSAMTSPTAKLVGAAAVGLVAGLAANLGRKTAVQAPSALAGDWFEAVKVEHKLALALFDQIEATEDSQAGKRGALLVQLKHALAKHAFTEENVLYPALREWGDKADADKLNHDHGYVKQSLFELEQMDKATPPFLTRITAFRADLEAHIREEEEAVFPPLHAALGEARNSELTLMANKEGFKLA